MVPTNVSEAKYTVCFRLSSFFGRTYFAAASEDNRRCACFRLIIIEFQLVSYILFEPSGQIVYRSSLFYIFLLVEFPFHVNIYNIFVPFINRIPFVLNITMAFIPAISRRRKKHVNSHLLFFLDIEYILLFCQHRWFLLWIIKSDNTWLLLFIDSFINLVELWSDDTKTIDRFFLDTLDTSDNIWETEFTWIFSFAFLNKRWWNFFFILKQSAYDRHPMIFG